MKTQSSSPPVKRFSRNFRIFSAYVGIAVISSFPLTLADVPSGSASQFGGIYKVASSTDPMFPVTGTREYFLDFGKGIQAGKLSGSVSISMRQNPKVQVRIMAWQYFPQQGRMVIGNPYAENSRNAVARAVWKMTGSANGVLFERGSYQVVLHRADPGDY